MHFQPKVRENKIARSARHKSMYNVLFLGPRIADSNCLEFEVLIVLTLSFWFSMGLTLKSLPASSKQTVREVGDDREILTNQPWCQRVSQRILGRLNMKVSGGQRRPRGSTGSTGSTRSARSALCTVCTCLHCQHCPTVCYEYKRFET